MAPRFSSFTVLVLDFFLFAASIALPLTTRASDAVEPGLNTDHSADNPVTAARLPIQDNSFLVEEAYNQEFGVVQHINTFTRSWNTHNWVYTFTQEWPVPGIAHQLSYTASIVSSPGFKGTPGIWLVHPRFNVMLETMWMGSESVIAPGRTQRSHDLLVSPGVRWAFNFASGLQIVPGVGVPIGVGPSAGDRGIFLYLSFEHPYQNILRGGSAAAISRAAPLAK